MLRRQDVNDGARYAAVRYLWNLGSPQAVDAMREAYDRKVMKAEPRLWMGLCEALAANGDGRGLPDAFEVLLDVERPAEPPLDEQKRRDWEMRPRSEKTRGRGRLRSGLEGIYSSSSSTARPMSPQPAEQQVVAPAPLAAARLAEAVCARRPGLGEAAATRKSPRWPGVCSIATAHRHRLFLD